MKHVIIELKYKVPIEVIDQYLHEHREFLDSGYKSNLLLASGPQNPREGGILIARGQTIEEIRNFCSRDPFYKNHCADYRFIEFIPVKYHNEVSTWFQPDHK